MVDFADFDTSEKANAGVPMPVVHPTTGEPLKTAAGEPITITLLGADSEAFKEAERRALKAMSDLSPYASAKLRSDTFQQGRAETLGAATVGWSGLLVDGEMVAFSEDAAVEIYRRFGRLADQADRFIGNQANFFRGPLDGEAA